MRRGISRVDLDAYLILSSGSSIRHWVLDRDRSDVLRLAFMDAYVI